MYSKFLYTVFSDIHIFSCRHAYVRQWINCEIVLYTAPHIVYTNVLLIGNIQQVADPVVDTETFDQLWCWIFVVVVVCVVIILLRAMSPWRHQCDRIIGIHAVAVLDKTILIYEVAYSLHVVNCFLDIFNS